MEVEDPVPELPSNRRRRWSGQFRPPNLAADLSESSDPDDEMEEQNEGAGDSSSAPPAPLRRSSRKKINMDLSETCKELSKPKKLSEKSSLKDIKNYYLSKHVRILNPSLETIFEEPQQVRNEKVVMSTRKYRRSIIFKPTTAKNPAKVRKRKLKAKQVLANKKLKKVPLKLLMEKLAELSDE